MQWQRKLLRTNKIVFIDKNGAINVDKGYTHKIEDFKLILGSYQVGVSNN